MAIGRAERSEIWMRWAVENAEIEVGDKFQSRQGPLNICVVQYRSVNGDVGYRIVGGRRTYHCSSDTFKRKWEPLKDEVSSER